MYTIKRLFFSFLVLLSVPVLSNAQDIIFSPDKAKTSGEIYYKAEVSEYFTPTNLAKGQDLDLKFNGTRFTQHIQEVAKERFGYTTISAISKTGFRSHSHLLMKDGDLSGILTFDGRSYRLSKKDGQQHLREINEPVLGCSVGEHEIPSALQKSTAVPPGGQHAIPSYDLTQFNDTTTVDVLILYTTAAKQWAANSSSVTDIDEVLALNESFRNQIIDNSEIALKIRFVDALEVDNPTAASTSDVLENMKDNSYTGSTHTSDTVDIHSLRDQYGADLVALLHKIDDTGGIAYRANNVGGAIDYAFSVNRIQQMYFDYVLMHEIGHNFGNAHGRTQASAEAGNSGGLFQFSTGHLLTSASDSSVTVMHYENLGDGKEATSIPYFSNPRVTYNGIATGSYALNTEGPPSDNALSMSISKNWLADYRLPVIDPPAISTTTTAIEDTVYPAGVSTRNLILQNTGNSDLEIKLDGKMEFSGSLKSTNANTIKQSLDLFYGFEESEGYESGSYTGYRNWIVVDEASPFEISSARAVSGTQSLKLDRSAGTPNVLSPFFSSTSRYSSYEITMKVYAESGPIDGYLEFNSSIDEENAASISLKSDNSIGFYGINGPDDSKSYWFYSGDNQITDQWVDVSIQISSADSGTITYNYGPDITRTFTHNGFYHPENLQLYISGSSSGDLYVDDIQIKAQDLYGPALTISDNQMTIPPGETDTMTVTFYGNGNNEGTYAGNLYLQTNAPNNTNLTIPIDLRIDPNNLYSNGKFAVELTGQAGFRMLTAPTDINLQEFLEPLHTQGMTNADFTNGSPNIWTWDRTFVGDSAESNLGWRSISDLDTTIQAGDSFLMYVYDEDVVGDSTSRGFPKLLTAEGQLVSSFSPAINQIAEGFTLIGNPFPSTVDWDQIYQNSGTDELSGSIYAHDPNSGWKSYNSDSNTGDLTNGLIKPFQGFFVQSSENITNGSSLTVESNDIVTGGEFYGKEQNQSPFVRFEITDSKRSISNSAFVVLNDKARSVKDDLDAVEMVPLSPSYITLGSMSTDDKELDINSIPYFDESIRIPLSVQASHSQKISFTLTEHSGFEDITIKITNGEWIKEVETDQGIVLEIVPDQSASKYPSGFPVRSKQNPVYTLILEKQRATSTGQTELPTEFSLSQNYPNPFNPSTSIRFGIPSTSHVKLSVYNVLGQLVKVLENDIKKPGYHSVHFDGENLSSGIYLYRLEVGSFVNTKKMLLMK
ncbi:MAG: hypothetical protein CL666_13470 [Balneola sp.]|mgnify:CR=1 FL=1|nr:hypothetical protein [Balneola sp.]|tara:strand:+ start:25345 stop:29022 length:3678 start_codon:yes stop_codon:yes gene_type:complete